MGYTRKELQLLGGGWNILPPVDKTPKTDYLLAQNWRVDREGRLVSRWGYPLKFSIVGPGYAHSAAIYGGDEGTYYVAANALLGSTPGAVYWDFNPTPIVTGLSGKRVGFAPMNGWMWIMDSAAQGRHNGTGYRNWGIDSPTAALTPAAGGAGGPNGSYQFYVTFGTSDQQFESNPGPVSVTVTVTSQAVVFSGIPVATDTQVGLRNIYATGGTLSSGGSNNAYLVGTLYDNVSTTFTWSTSDLTVTNAGIVMPTTHDGPPAGRGLAGPHFSRLFTWAGNRLYYTDPNLPQYWPGSADPATGNWVDVGMDGENIQWCTVHSNVLMIYKQRSIWRLVGDPDSGSLEMVEDGVGLTNAFAIATGAGPVDYFVAPNGLRRCNMDRTEAMGPEIRPLFNTPILNNGSPLQPPGSIVPGPDWLSVDSIDAYAIALGYAMGKLYVAYGENTVSGTGSVLLVYDDQSQRWMYHRNGLGLDMFHGFLFDGAVMAGLTGSGGSGDAVTQLTLSVPGIIAVSSNAAPLVSLSTTAQSAGIAAMLGTPASGGGVTVQVFGGATLLGTITIPDGASLASAAATGATIAANTPITLAITAVPGAFPGADLSVQMWFYTGSLTTPAQALGYNLDDFRGFYTQDEPVTSIECVYQSHFEDCGLPDNQKVWLEVVVDYLLNSGNTATVYVGYDNFAPAAVGTITGAGLRKQTSFALGTDGTLAKNISVAIDCQSSAQVELYNVYLYYYVEARLALAASTIPTDLGSAKVKQCKELMLDIDASGGAVNVNLYSDLPGNQLTVRHTPTVATTAGRALMKYPFAVTEGFLWRIALKAAAGAFRLYSARLLMRVIGVYIEAYEAAAGFVWDSMEMTFESGITHVPRAYAIALAASPIKRFREISLEIDTFNGNVLVTFLTDLPGEAQTSRFTATVNTASGRRYVRLPLPGGVNAPIEGRMCRVQISGTSKFVLYDASVEVLAVGVYIEAYEAAGGAVYDSRELDFGSAKVKEAREIELDIETTGTVTATLYSDLPGYTMAQVFQSTSVSTTGRQKIKLPVTTGAAPYSYPVGRLFRLILTGANAFRLYEAKLRIREFGTYLTGEEASGGGVWDSTPLDFESERLKEFKKLEFEVQTDGTATLNMWTDQPAGALTSQYTTTIATGGARQSVKIPLTPGIRGRLLQAEISGAGVRLFAGRVWWRPWNEPKAQWNWSPLPIEPTPPQWTWAPFMVPPTEPQWFWAKCLSIDETPDKWEWIDVPFEVSA